MLVIITKRYDSSVLKQKVHPTLIDNDGKPINPLTVSDERGRVLIAAGVAKEYIPTTDEDMDNSAVQTVSESNDNSDAKEGDVVTDDSSAAAEDDAENAEDKSAETETTEETDAKEESKDVDDETKSKKETKKNKESK